MTARPGLAGARLREALIETARPSRREMVGAVVAGSIGLVARRAEALGMALQPAGEILIRGGRVVNADGTRDADVRIVGELIAEVGSGLRPGAGARVIEAKGHFVLPGGIDPHNPSAGWLCR